MAKPIVLTILDGWGFRAATHGNAIALARKPVYDGLLRDFPNTLLHASDHFVGLPDGQMGNSEVGHLNLGAGRIVRMDMTRIDLAIADGSFFTDATLLAAIAAAQEKGGALQGGSLHIIGLLSDGGVHSHVRHLYALLRLAAQNKLPKVFVHAFMDGRDTSPTGGVGYLEQLEQQFREIGVGALASVSGRYYAMDRDLRWEKEKQAFDALVTGHPEGGTYTDAVVRMKELYHSGVTDEFVPPFTVVDAAGHAVGPIRDNDVVINFNYRADRARQITRVLARNSGLTLNGGADLPKAAELDAEIPKSLVPTGLHYVCMTQYDRNFKLPIVIPAESMDNLLAHLMAQANLRNLRVAETEKYAHVTYFFNGGIEKPFGGEDRALVPSQKVATYDLAPEMSAAGIADAVIKAVADTAFDVIIVNFANADMVGHSGKLEPTIKAVETVDRELGRVYQAVKQRGGSLLVTADHGNAEMLIDPVTGGPHTAHTTNPVPFILVTDAKTGSVSLRPDGSLRDISPTMLGLLKMGQPKDMTGGNLIVPLVS
jgi:2,3-bisphosphoglycerate-independent phosphoglycerate mutase